MLRHWRLRSDVFLSPSWQAPSFLSQKSLFKIIRDFGEWSEWDERHGRLRREVTVERGGSCRDTSGADTA